MRPQGVYLLADYAADLIYGPDQRAAIAELVEIADRPTPETQLIFSGWGAPVMDEKFLAALPELKSSVVAPLAARAEMMKTVLMSLAISGYGVAVLKRMVSGSTMIFSVICLV